MASIRHIVRVPVTLLNVKQKIRPLAVMLDRHWALSYTRCNLAPGTTSVFCLFQPDAVIIFTSCATLFM